MTKEQEKDYDLTLLCDHLVGSDVASHRTEGQEDPRQAFASAFIRIGIEHANRQRKHHSLRAFAAGYAAAKHGVDMRTAYEDWLAAQDE